MYNKVYVEITNICNMNCSFCHGHSRAPGKMTREDFARVLDKLKGHTGYIYYHLMGEPLIHPQLPEFIQMAKEGGFRSILTTNGTLLQKRQDALLNAGLFKVNISIHSFEDDSEANHIRYILGLTDFAKKAADAGTIVTFRLWNKGFDNGKNALALKVLQENIPGEWAENTRGIRIREKMFIEFGERFEWPDTNAGIQSDTFHCYGLKDQFGILVDGTVVPCCLDSDGIINLGNIFNEEIEQILNSKRALDILEGFQRGKASEDLCKRCHYAQRFV